MFGSTLLAVDEHALGRRDTAQLQSYFPTRGNERALAFVEADGDAAFRGLAGDPAPGVLTLFVPETVPGILVDRGFSFALARVDEQCQRVDRLLAGMGGVRPYRDGRVCFYVEGRFAEGCVCQDVGRSFEALAAVVVEPDAFGQVDVAVFDAGAGYGRDQESVAQQELVIRRKGGLVFRILEQEGAQYRCACPVALVEERVEVGEEPLAELDHLPAHRLVGFSERPGLLATGPNGGVVAAVRLEDPELVPAGQKLSVRVAPESSDIYAGPRDAGKSEVLQLRHAHPQVLPPAGVVPGPVHGVALQTSVPCAGDHERPLVRPQGEESLPGGAGHQGTVGVVDLGVPPGLAGSATGMNHIIRHRGPRWYKERRLVHVAPDPRHSRIGQNSLVLAPPPARLRVGEVGEGAHAGPDGILVLLPVARLAVEILRPSLGVDGVILVYLHAGVDDGDDAEALFSQVGDQTLRVGEARFVPRKHSVAVHVMDVQVVTSQGMSRSRKPRA